MIANVASAVSAKTPVTSTSAPASAGFLSPRQAARLLNYDLGYLYKLIWSGRLTAEKIDGQWRISREAVNARLQAKV